MSIIPVMISPAMKAHFHAFSLKSIDVIADANIPLIPVILPKKYKIMLEESPIRTPPKSGKMIFSIFLVWLIVSCWKVTKRHIIPNEYIEIDVAKILIFNL